MVEVAARATPLMFVLTFSLLSAATETFWLISFVVAVCSSTALAMVVW